MVHKSPVLSENGGVKTLPEKGALSGLENFAASLGCNGATLRCDSSTIFSVELGILPGPRRRGQSLKPLTRKAFLLSAAAVAVEKSMRCSVRDGALPMKNVRRNSLKDSTTFSKKAQGKMVHKSPRAP